MEMIEGQDYATIKNNSLIMIDDVIWDWIPDAMKTSHGRIPEFVKHAYLGAVFKVDNRKPYPMRNRIKLSHTFPPYVTIAGYKEVRAWLEDLTLYTWDGQMLVPHAPVRIRKSKPMPECPSESLALDMNDDLTESEADTARDIGSLETDFE